MSKITEAQEHLKEAQKALEPSSFFGLMKGTPNYDTAAAYFDKAALAFKNGKSWNDAISAHEKAADAYQRVDQLFMAAKTLEGEAQVWQLQLNQPTKASNTLERASKLYRLHGSPDKAADALERAGKLLESTDADKAIDLMVQASDLLDEEDRGRFATESLRKSVVLCLKNGKIDRAIPIQEKLVGVWQKIGNKTQLAKAQLGSVILSLKAGNIERAKQNLLQYGDDGFQAQEEGRCAMELVGAVENGDDEGLQTALSYPAVQYLDNELVRLSKTLQVVAKPKPVQVSVGTRETETKLADLAQEIEEEGIL